MIAWGPGGSNEKGTRQMPTAELTELTSDRARRGARNPRHRALPRPADLPGGSTGAGWRTSTPMTDLSLEHRQALAGHFSITTLPISRRDIVGRRHGEVPARAAGRPAHRVGLHPAIRRNQTFCISTQVGCAMGCAFCLTATMGLVRNLTPGEIVGQVRVLADVLGLRDARFNIVLMGMGEPLHNYDRTMAALRILTDPHGLAVPREADHAVDGGAGAGDRAARGRAHHAEPRGVAARTHRRIARDARAGQPQVRRPRDHRGLPSVPARETGPHHLRVRAAGGRERLARGRGATGGAAARHAGESEPDPAQSRGGHPVRAAIGRASSTLRPDPGRARHHRVGAQEPRAATSAPPAGSSRSKGARSPPRRGWRTRSSSDGIDGSALRTRLERTAAGRRPHGLLQTAAAAAADSTASRQTRRSGALTRSRLRVGDFCAAAVRA